MEEKKVIKKKKHSLKRIVILLLILYIVIYLFYYFFKLPIKNIYINGNTRVSDNEIIEIAKIKNYPSIFKTSAKTLSKRIKKLQLIDNVEIDKSLKGVLTINVKENKILFFQKTNNKIVLENGRLINDNNYLGVPILVNFVPDEIFEELVVAFAKVDADIISGINEIQYSPYKNSNNIVIDNQRFLLRMNDGNIVYVNLLNIKKLNYYNDIHSSLDNKGILYLDSEDDEHFVFNEYGK